MGQDQPLVLVALLGLSVYVARMWWDDLRAARAGGPSPRALPGATPAPVRAIGLAAAGGLVLVAAETAGEYALGIEDQQSRMTALFGLYTLAAAFVEELVFRGFVVVEHRGRAALVGGCVGASTVFALLHPFLWRWDEAGFAWQGTTKAWFSTAAIFAGSLWFYAVRFWSLNPTRSLLPCIAAHAAKNLGVFAVKAAQGHVSGWW
jgi:membrane protease YdiL (CAAX protease family)